MQYRSLPGNLEGWEFGGIIIEGGAGCSASVSDKGELLDHSYQILEMQPLVKDDRQWHATAFTINPSSAPTLRMFFLST